MENIGYTMDSLTPALNAFQDTATPNAWCRVQICTQQMPTQEMIDEIYRDVLFQGFEAYPITSQIVGGIPTTTITFRNSSVTDVNHTGFVQALGLIVPIIVPLATLGLWAWGINKIQDISDAITPILLIAFGGIIITAVALRKPAEVAASRYLSRYMPDCEVVEMQPMTRVRYNRADLNDTINAAIRLNSDRNKYISATAYGYVIENSPPPSIQRYIIVYPGGKYETIEPKFLPDTSDIVTIRDGGDSYLTAGSVISRDEYKKEYERCSQAGLKVPTIYPAEQIRETQDISFDSLSATLVKVECPLCHKVIEAPSDHKTRTDILMDHINKDHGAYQTENVNAPFVKGERIRYIGGGTYRYSNWPEGVYLKDGMIGTIVRIAPRWQNEADGRKYANRTDWAVVRWDGGGEIGIAPEEEGRKWERIQTTIPNFSMPETKNFFLPYAPYVSKNADSINWLHYENGNHYAIVAKGVTGISREALVEALKMSTFEIDNVFDQADIPCAAAEDKTVWWLSTTRNGVIEAKLYNITGLSNRQLEDIFFNTTLTVLKTGSLKNTIENMPETGDDTVIEGLLKSQREELEAMGAYVDRERIAKESGDSITAELYHHTAEDEGQHFREFTDRAVELGVDFMAESPELLADTALNANWRTEIEQALHTAIERVNI